MNGKVKKEALWSLFFYFFYCVISNNTKPQRLLCFLTDAPKPRGFSVMEITGLEPAAYALRTHRYPNLAISPYNFILAYFKENARGISI